MSEAQRPEIGLQELLSALWAGRWRVAAVTATCALMAAVYAFTATPVFRSQVLLQPREEGQAKGGLGGLLGQVGGLAGIAGLSLGGGGDRSVAIATLKSRTLVEAFIREEGLLQRIYEDEWDAANNVWKDPDNAPTAWRAYDDLMDDVLSVSEDKATGLVTVGIEWTDPAHAQEWASKLVARTNGHLKAVAIAEAERNLAYLEGQARSVNQVELRQAVYSLVESEMNKLMLARGANEFALRTIDAAVVPEEPFRPKRVLAIVLGFSLGGFLGVLWVVVRASWQS